MDEEQSRVPKIVGNDQALTFRYVRNFPAVEIPHELFGFVLHFTRINVHIDHLSVEMIDPAGEFISLTVESVEQIHLADGCRHSSPHQDERYRVVRAAVSRKNDRPDLPRLDLRFFDKKRHHVVDESLKCTFILKLPPKRIRSVARPLRLLEMRSLSESQKRKGDGNDNDYESDATRHNSPDKAFPFSNVNVPMV